MNGKTTLWDREPVLLSSFVKAVLGLLVAFGFSLTDVQIVSIMGVVDIGLAILARSQVTSPATLAEDYRKK